jgi:hypothetical protein
LSVKEIIKYSRKEVTDLKKKVLEKPEVLEDLSKGLSMPTAAAAA